MEYYEMNAEIIRENSKIKAFIKDNTLTRNQIHTCLDKIQIASDHGLFNTRITITQNKLTNINTINLIIFRLEELGYNAEKESDDQIFIEW